MENKANLGALKEKEARKHFEATAERATKQ